VKSIYCAKNIKYVRYGGELVAGVAGRKRKSDGVVDFPAGSILSTI